MLPVGWLILAVVVAVLLTVWVSFTATRLDRLHARVDAAQAALDAQLVRRAAALLHVAQSTQIGLSEADHRRYEDVAQTALIGAPGERQSAENAVGRAVSELASGPAPLAPESDRELREAAQRVLIARRFYNDAVRDTRTLRARRMPRLLRLAGRRNLPEFFDFDDTPPVAPDVVSSDPVVSRSAPTTVDTAKDSG
ncbi:MAG: hypothetical protein QOG80_217 [Pseudonocardiales bacterium]|nr:hypothetical protein [Pseudonocardiales bacterium]